MSESLASTYGRIAAKDRPVLFWKGASDTNEGMLLAGIIVSPAELAEVRRAALEAHTPWARAVFAEQRIWLACYCGWNAMGEESGAWNDHVVRLEPA